MAENVEFRGKAGEWFGIWIVNVVLTILTVGIYSAWAKVRTKQYFYRNTFVGGRNFDYHATGLQILIGRVIVIIGFVVYSLLAVVPVLAIIMTLALFVAVPFLFYRSLRFNARVTSWSGVRFDFTGTYGGAFKAFMLYPFLTAFSLYLAWPFAERAQSRFVVNNHRLGRSAFEFESPIGPFYKAFGIAIVVFLGAMILVAINVVPVFMAASQGLLLDEQAVMISVFTSMIPAILLFMVAVIVFKTMVRNIVFNAAILDGKHRFSSDLNPFMIAWIALSNTAVVLLTLGLLLPWAQIRMARYVAAHTGFLPEGSLDDFIAHKQAEASAIGDAYTDIEGIELGLGI